MLNTEQAAALTAFLRLVNVGRYNGAKSISLTLEQAEVLAEALRPQTPSEAAMREGVKTAYGYLWHVNNEPASPVPLYSPQKAAYEARRALRDLLTSTERGEAINAVGVLLGKFTGT